MHREKWILGVFFLSLVLTPTVAAKLQTKSTYLAEIDKKSTVIQAKPIDSIKPEQPQQVAPPPAPVVPLSPPEIVMATLKDLGVSHRAAAYLTGSFEQESGLTPCGSEYSDGGLAYGLNQWHPDRRYDMPCDLAEQTKWAIDTEMVRDTPWAAEVIRNPNANDEQIKSAIYAWTRWGVLGNRWQLAQKYF